MIPRTTLSLTARHHARLRAHLFPGDGKEAASVLVCSHVPGQRLRLLVRDVLPVPHDECAERSSVKLTWPGAYLEKAIDVAQASADAIVLMHSHPSGFAAFSQADDESDQEVMPCLHDAVSSAWHGSAVMLPSGSVLARLYGGDMAERPVDLISVAGDDLHYWWRDDLSDSSARPMAFTSDMTCELSRLTAVVIGASGTGSPTIEQLSRLGFGQVIAIDHDLIEERNLNRILNATMTDATAKRPKVSVMAERLNPIRAATFLEGVDANVMTRSAVLEAARGDVVFCCVDSLRARMVADRLSAAFLLPLFDVGVLIPTRGQGADIAIAEVTGRLDYVYPGGSTLGDRGVYTPASLQAEYLADADPVAHAAQRRAGYIQDHPEEAPSVIALNMRAASACVMEFIMRAYPFRHSPNANYARTRFMLAECVEEHTGESKFTASHSALLATGSKEPLLGLPALCKEG
jgi:hypothetical protein